MNCSDCRFFKPQASRNSWGSCRRYPPMGQDSMWPDVSAEAWCGEHKYATGVSGISHAQNGLASDFPYEPTTVAVPDLMDALARSVDAARERRSLPTITVDTLREMERDERELRPADLPQAKGKKP